VAAKSQKKNFLISIDRWSVNNPTLLKNKRALLENKRPLFRNNLGLLNYSRMAANWWADVIRVEKRLWAGARINTGSRPNIYGPPPESDNMPSRSLLHAV
jgi:hypothetical protein